MALPIEKINSRLEGEFRFRGRAHSVPFTMPGDLIQFKLHRARGRLGMEVVKIEPGPQEGRIAPFCAYYGDCGGCRGQHLPYEEQLRLKSRPIVEKMMELGLTPEVVPAPEQRGHRRRMDFSVEGSIVGLRGAGSFDRFVDLEVCAVQNDSANGVLALVRKLLQRHPAGFVRATGSGVLKYCTIRTGSIHSVLVLTYEMGRQDDPVYRSFIEELIQALPDSWSLVGVPTTAPSDVSCPAGGTALRGEPFFRERLGGIEFAVDYDAFFQPNPAAFELILDFARQHAPAGAAARLVDLYCGAGVLSSIWTSWFSAEEILGLEVTASAVHRAPENLQHFKGNARFLACDLQNRLPEELRPTDLVICDPPRAGLSPAVRKAILEGKPQHLLYVSCNPDSQVKDLREIAAGYRIRAAAIVDCYPQAGHLEQAVWLEANV
jgi:23S rRNA (uracil-5-)-methyltransferase RumA